MGGSDYCKPLLPKQNTSHILILKLRGLSAGRGKIASTSVAMTDLMTSQHVAFYLNTEAFKPGTDDWVVIGLSGDVSDERRNLRNL